VRGPFRLVDPEGRPIENTRSPVALCRCGKSRAKPFCDGTHKLIGFSTQTAGTGEESSLKSEP